MIRRAWLALWLACVAPGCSLSHRPAGEQDALREPGSSEADSAAVAGAGSRDREGAAAAAAGAIASEDPSVEPVRDPMQDAMTPAVPEAPVPEAPAPPPQGRKAEVWIGELWSLDAVLCEQEPPFLFGDGKPRTERVVLVLDDGAVPTGRIRFAQGELPSAPVPEPDDPPSGWGTAESFFWCSRSELARGGEYSLFESHRTATRLEFLVMPAEVWQPWCASRGKMAAPCPPGPRCDGTLELCPCGADGCEPSAGRRIHFDFSIDGDEMEALILRTAQLRLKRVQ